MIRCDVIFDWIDWSGKTPSVNLLARLWFTKKEFKKIFLASQNLEQLVYNIKLVLDDNLKLVVWDRLILSLYFILKDYYKLSDDELEDVYKYIFKDYDWKIFLIFLNSSWEVMCERIIKRGDISENDLKLIKDKQFYKKYKQIFEESFEYIPKILGWKVKILKLNTDCVPTNVAIFLYRIFKR